MKISDRFGLKAEIKNMRAGVQTSNDPFDQTDGGSMTLVLDGVIVGLTGFLSY